MSKENISNKVQLLGATCLVVEDRQDETTSGGIFIPGRDKEQTNKGTVLAIGTGAMLEDGTKVPMHVSVGDNVIYSSFSGSPIKVSEKDKDNYIILNERDILCIYSE